MVIAEILAGFVQILTSPVKDLSVLWLIIPIFAIWILLEVYFERHKGEEISWDTALGSAFSIFWVGIILSKYFFEKKIVLWPKFAIPLAIIIYSLALIFVSFKRKLPKSAEFLLVSPTVINYIIIICILWIYGLLAINRWVLLDLIILFGIVVTIFLAVRKSSGRNRKDA